MEKYVVKKAFSKDVAGFKGKDKYTALGYAKNPKVTKKPLAGGGKAGLQLTTAKTNPNVRRWQQTQPKQAQQQEGQPQGQPQRKPYWGQHSGAEVGHKVNYHGNPITVTGVGEHGVTARDEHGRKFEIFHHELRKKGI